ncbi:MAG: sulfite exporter TauE/SafE family protein [Deltaproteobacteria bacterium]|nr:sulfite exporter TauE/SafE family protein [Deltaproteobacteria bacterium]
MSAITVALLLLIVTFAFAVESTIGFGATVITVSFGALIADIDQVLPAYVPVNMALSGYLALRYLRLVDRRVLLTRIAPFVAVGMPVGFWLKRRVAPAVGVKMFGAFVVCLALSELVSRIRRANKPDPSIEELHEPPMLTWLRDAVAMTGCGVLFGMYGTGGPLAVWSVSHHARDPGVFRATLAMLWLLLNAVVLAEFWRAGTLNHHSLWLTAAFVPALGVGTLVGERLHRTVPATTFRSAVFALLFAVGLVLLLRR